MTDTNAVMRSDAYHRRKKTWRQQKTKQRKSQFPSIHQVMSWMFHTVHIFHSKQSGATDHHESKQIWNQISPVGKIWRTPSSFSIPLWIMKGKGPQLNQADSRRSGYMGWTVKPAVSLLSVYTSLCYYISLLNHLHPPPPPINPVSPLLQLFTQIDLVNNSMRQSWNNQSQG